MVARACPSFIVSGRIVRIPSVRKSVMCMVPFYFLRDRFFKKIQGARYGFKTCRSAEVPRNKTRRNHHEEHLEADMIRSRDLVAWFHCSRALRAVGSGGWRSS